MFYNSSSPHQPALWKSVSLTPWHASINTKQMFKCCFTKSLKICGFRRESVCGAGYIQFYILHFHSVSLLSWNSHNQNSLSKCLIADYISTYYQLRSQTARKQMDCVYNIIIQGYLSSVVTGSEGMSVSTRSSVSTMCSDSGDEDSAGITTTGLMCSDRADARRKLGGFCKGTERKRLSIIWLALPTRCFHQDYIKHTGLIWWRDGEWNREASMKSWGRSGSLTITFDFFFPLLHLMYVSEVWALVVDTYKAFAALCSQIFVTMNNQKNVKKQNKNIQI